MVSELQLLVDQLFEQVKTGVVLENDEHRTIVYSYQEGPIDSIRRDSILHRETPPDLIRWYRTLGIREARGILRIPAYEEFDMLARICAPVRHRSELLGFLWLIDKGTLNDSQLANIENAADRAALMLYGERLTRRLVVAALAQLISPSEELRETAARQLIDQSLLCEGEPVVAIVVQPIPRARIDSRTVEAVLLDSLAEAPTSSMLGLARSDHGFAVVQLQTIDDDSPAIAIAESAKNILSRRLSAKSPGNSQWRVVSAIGDQQCGLEGIVTSYRHARLAVKVACAIPSIGDIVRWHDLGAFRVQFNCLIVKLRRPQSTRGLLPCSGAETGTLLRPWRRT